MTAAAKILLFGCNGQMGHMFTRTASNYGDMAIVGGVDAVPAKQDGGYIKPPYEIIIIEGGGDVAENTDKALEFFKGLDIDVIVDFSHPSALSLVLSIAVKRSIPAIIAATGHSRTQLAEISNASKKIPVFQTPNMSIGINLMSELIKTAAATLAENFDIELIEAHHNRKVDAPSGTALNLANAMNEVLSGELEYVYDRHEKREKRGKKELGIHTIRGGTIVGEHSVIFAGKDEVIEIKHTAMSREVFAEGAVRAVRFMVKEGREAGLYNMGDVIRSV